MEGPLIQMRPGSGMAPSIWIPTRCPLFSMLLPLPAPSQSRWSNFSPSGGGGVSSASGSQSQLAINSPGEALKYLNAWALPSEVLL